MMHIVVARVDETLFEGEADSITVPGAEGEMTVYGGHEAFVTTLKEGIITIRGAASGTHHDFHVTGGVIEVQPGGVTVIL